MATQEPETREPVSEQENHRPGEVTQLLLKWKEGDANAFDRLTAIVNGELRRRAHHYLRREREAHTIQTTALVDDVWMRLGGDNEVDWQNRAHFYAIAAEVMRRILVEEARKRDSLKRGGGMTRASFEEPMTITVELDLDLLALDEALEWLKERSARKYQVVVLRFFVGMKIEEIATVLKITPAAVKSDWESAKLLLFGQLNRKGNINGSSAI